MGQWVMAFLAGAAAAPADQLAESADSYSVHLEHAELQLGIVWSLTFRPSAPEAGDPPEAWVYGYLPYWANNLNTVAWDSLTHVAVFDVGVDSNANLTPDLELDRYGREGPEKSRQVRGSSPPDTDLF